MSSSTSTERSSETLSGHWSYVRDVGQLLLKGVSVGLLAGMGAFVYNMPQFLTVEVDLRVLLAPIVAAGAFAHLFAPTLRHSVRLGFVGFFVGLAVLVGAWVSPVWILGYPAGTRDFLLIDMAQKALTAAVITYSTAYASGYLLTVSVSAIWE